jgi:dimethylamine--corrinoid protein Co-methyltransferase
MLDGPTKGVRIDAMVVTRMGDGSCVEKTRDELRADIEDGVRQGAGRAKVPPLTPEEIDHLLEIFASAARMTGVPLGDEVVLSCDGSTGLRLSKLDSLAEAERVGGDLCELQQDDYSYKAVKTAVAGEQRRMQEAQYRLTIPVQYGAQADLGRYSVPDGPVPNWSQLLPEGRIDEARAAQEEAAREAEQDMYRVAAALWEAGADGIDFDTSGAAGDADFLAVLNTVRRLRADFPDLGIEVGMASEFVLGMHGELEFDSVRLAGLWPQDQLRLLQDAGATVFGPAVNVNTGRTVAWNVARALTIIKPCMAAASIPVHVNAGMGVGGVPMHLYPPIDAVSRVSRAFVEILRIDGL